MLDNTKAKDLNQRVDDYQNRQLPNSGSILAIDFGLARLGLAISDGLQIGANPLPIIYAKGLSKTLVWGQICKLCQQREVVGIVFGIPKHKDGNLGQLSAQISNFADGLEKASHLPITMIDERYTSRSADERLQEFAVFGKKRKNRQDSIAAMMILEAYLQKSGDKRTASCIERKNS